MHTRSTDFGGTWNSDLKRFLSIICYTSAANVRLKMSSVFWHGLIRAPFVANASALAQTTLYVPKSSVFYRQIVTILVFILSGGMHRVGVWVMYPGCDITPTLQWFFLIGLTMAAEDLFRRIFSGVAAGRQWRVLGYLWVWIYLSWSLPKMRFPMFGCL